MTSQPVEFSKNLFENEEYGERTVAGVISTTTQHCNTKRTTKWWRHHLSNFRKICSKTRSTAKLWLEWSQQQNSDATRMAKKRRQKKQQRERASNRLEIFLISICVWLNTAACERLYETGGITNEGGEKTILQSNNMVALRVSLLYLGMVWYYNIEDDIRDDIYQRSIKYVHIPTGKP